MGNIFTECRQKDVHQTLPAVFVFTDRFSSRMEILNWKRTETIKTFGTLNEPWWEISIHYLGKRSHWDTGFRCQYKVFLRAVLYHSAGKNKSNMKRTVCCAAAFPLCCRLTHYRTSVSPRMLSCSNGGARTAPMTTFQLSHSILRGPGRPNPHVCSCCRLVDHL